MTRKGPLYNSRLNTAGNTSKAPKKRGHDNYDERVARSRKTSSRPSRLRGKSRG